MTLNTKTYNLSDVCTIIAGQSPDSQSYNKNGDGIPFFQGKADFGILYPRITTYCSQPLRIAEKDDILLSVRAPVGPTNLAPCKVCIGRGLSAIRPCSKLNIKFVLYFFKYFESQLAQKGTGTTFKAITQDIIKKIQIPVPPLAEQERIVAKIEELFSELDSAVSELKNVKEKLQIYRQAVLKEAFEDLNRTEKIRNVSQFVTSGSRGWAKYYSDKGAKFIRIGNLSHTSIDINLEEIQCVTLPQKTEGTRSLLSPNDVLVSITADLGAIALVPENLGEAYINQHIAMIRFSTPELGKFFAWYLQSDYGQKQLLKNRRGNGKLGLGLDDIRDSEVPIITESKAHIIVDKIEQQLSQCNSIDQTVNNMILKTAALRQSILKQAFEGKL